jgi:hypothetical protein
LLSLLKGRTKNGSTSTIHLYAAYEKVDHQDVFFSLDNIVGTAAEGTFDGTENGNIADTTFHFTGSFKNSYIEFTCSNGPIATKKFTGNFDKNAASPYKITEKNGSGIINLRSV